MNKPEPTFEHCSHEVGMDDEMVFDRLWDCDNMQPCKVGDGWYWRPDYPCKYQNSKHANATI